jgi:VWFA-related protein
MNNLSVSDSTALAVAKASGRNTVFLGIPKPERRIMKRRSLLQTAGLFGCLVVFVWVPIANGTTLLTQGDSSSRKTKRGPAKPVIVPVGIKVRGTKPEELQLLDLNVSEDGEAQSMLSIRSIYTNSPMAIAILIQDDLVSSVSLEIKALREFIARLPKGSRVMIGYIRSGSLEVRQKFTTDLEKAASVLRTPLGVASAAPYNPYVEVLEGLGRFDSQPAGRRSMLIISDGLDTSRGIDSSDPGQSVDLQRAINQAQRRSVAVYSFYAPSVALASSSNQVLVGNGQSSLERLATETGGKAFFQGTGAPVSFNPYLSELSACLDRQIALTYLSTHANKGFHRLQIRSLTAAVELTYPAGYTR